MKKIKIYRPFDDDLLYGEIDDLIAALQCVRAKFGNVELDLDGIGNNEYCLEYCIERPLSIAEIDNIEKRREVLFAPYEEQGRMEIMRLNDEFHILRRDENEKYLAQFD